MHSSLIGKIEKANRYSRELDRITIERLSLTFRGDNDTHHVTLDGDTWHCTCHFFEGWKTCVHVLATLLGESGTPHLQVDVQGRGRLAEAFDAIVLGDLVSVYLACLYGLDPTPVMAIQALKERLAGE